MEMDRQSSYNKTASASDSCLAGRRLVRMKTEMSDDNMDESMNVTRYHVKFQDQNCPQLQLDDDKRLKAHNRWQFVRSAFTNKTSEAQQKDKDYNEYLLIQLNLKTAEVENCKKQLELTEAELGKARRSRHVKVWESVRMDGSNTGRNSYNEYTQCKDCCKGVGDNNQTTDSDQQNKAQQNWAFIRAVFKDQRAMMPNPLDVYAHLEFAEGQLRDKTRLAEKYKKQLDDYEKRKMSKLGCEIEKLTLKRNKLKTAIQLEKLKEENKLMDKKRELIEFEESLLRREDEIYERERDMQVNIEKFELLSKGGRDNRRKKSS